MIVIADTTPINYLVLIEQVAVLPVLYKRIIVPEAVVTELKRESAPTAVRTWIGQPPGWIEVCPDPPVDPSLEFLDYGERAALSLAELLKADKLIIDDWAGRTEAARRRFKVTGTLGVLAEAHLLGLLVFDDAVARLRGTNFRLSDQVERDVRRIIADASAC